MFLNFRYLCDKYDIDHRLRPADCAAQAAVNIWIHAAESTFMLFGLAVLYARWSFPATLKQSNPEALEQMEAGMSANVHKSFEWLEDTLSQSTSGWLVGDNLMAADIMTHFSASFLLERQLGTKGKKWAKVEEWVKRCEATDSYQRAVKKSGYSLYPTSTWDKS
jgi:glutathione S-transferase